MKTKCSKHGCDLKANIVGAEYCPECTKDEMDRVRKGLYSLGFGNVEVHSLAECPCPTCVITRARKVLETAKKAIDKAKDTIEGVSTGKIKLDDRSKFWKDKADEVAKIEPPEPPTITDCYWTTGEKTEEVDWNAELTKLPRKEGK